MMFPDLDIIVLNATASSVVSLRNFFAPLTTATSSISATNYNQLKLYNSIVSGSNSTSGSFQLQSSETVLVAWTLQSYRCRRVPDPK